MTFKEFFRKNSQNYNSIEERKYVRLNENNAENFEDILDLLRKNGYKIKIFTPTKFGLQIDFAKKYNLEELKNLLNNYDYKIKDNSIFIEF